MGLHFCSQPATLHFFGIDPKATREAYHIATLTTGLLPRKTCKASLPFRLVRVLERRRSMLTNQSCNMQHCAGQSSWRHRTRQARARVVVARASSIDSSLFKLPIFSSRQEKLEKQSMDDIVISTDESHLMTAPSPSIVGMLCYQLSRVACTVRTQSLLMEAESRSMLAIPKPNRGHVQFMRHTTWTCLGSSKSRPLVP